MNYQPSSIAGERYVRAKRVILENPLGGTPSAAFIEQQALTVDGETITRDIGALNESMIDPNTTFPLLNPPDDSVIGQATYADLYALVYSLHRHLAGIRDANV
jgi:hypothetical protein